MFHQVIILNIVLIGVCVSVIACEGCSKQDHQKCISLADPLLKDPHLIFPDNIRDIDMVCRTWSSFVDCIKKYIDRCFTKQRREQFNAAVEEPIASVHQMCSVSTYQSEYLQYATCLKATVTETQHCGNQYDILVEEVSKGDMARTSLCCAHHHFRACVISKTLKRCDGGQSDGAASRFSRQILDRALSFLHDQCQNYIPNSNDCLHGVTESTLVIAVSPLNDDDEDNNDDIDGPENHGISRRPYYRAPSPDTLTQGQANNLRPSPSSFRNNGRSINVLPKEESDNHESQTIMDNNHVTPDNDNISKIDDSVGHVVEEKKDVVSTVGPAIVMTPRSSSFGRGLTWTSPTKTTKEIPAWATATTPIQDIATDSLFPAAGSFGGINIDEPNQQGLKNSQTNLRFSSSIFLILNLIITFLYYQNF